MMESSTVVEYAFGLVKAFVERWSPLKLGIILLSIVWPSLVLSHYYRSWKRLAHIPGPLAAHFSIFWLLRHAWRGNLFPSMIQAGEQYGPLTRIGPNLLLCSDPNELRAISGVHSEYTKGPAYDALRVTEGEPHVVSERHPVKHKALRAKMGPGYSIDPQPAIDRQISMLIELIYKNYTPVKQNGTGLGSQHELPARIMNLGEKMQFYALDFIGDFVFSEPFGFLQRDEDVHRITQINDLSLRMATIAGLVPWLVHLRSKWPFKLLLPREGDQVGFGMLFGFAKSLVDKRTAESAVPKDDMMQAFIRSGMTRDQLMQQVYVHVIAGSDSTSNWARMTMLCLLTCPPAYMRLQREIDDALACGNLSGPIATGTETRNLPYLDAVLRESIRLLPPSVSPSKLSPRTPQNKSSAISHTVCGFHVPSGTQIGANVPGILRSEATFGSDAQCFRPERWLDTVDSTDQARLIRMKSALDIVFGAGKFQCIGTALAWAEVRKLFVELIRRFDFALVDNIKPLRVESFAIMVVHGFNVRVTPRLSEEEAKSRYGDTAHTMPRDI